MLDRVKNYPSGSQQFVKLDGSSGHYLWHPSDLKDLKGCEVDSFWDLYLQNMHILLNQQQSMSNIFKSALYYSRYRAHFLFVSTAPQNRQGADKYI